MSTSEQQAQEIYADYMNEAYAYAQNQLEGQAHSPIDFYDKVIEWVEGKRSSEGCNQDQLDRVIETAQGFIEAHRTLIAGHGAHLRL